MSYSRRFQRSVFAEGVGDVNTGMSIHVVRWSLDFEMDSERCIREINYSVLPILETI